jgi:hypothetical protein
MDAYIKHNDQQISVITDGVSVLLEVENVDNFIIENNLTGKEFKDVPQTVSRRQLRLALSFAQFDLSQIDQQINQLLEPNKTFALIAWNDAVVFERNDALLNQLALQLGLNEDALDDLFINAEKL